MLTFVYHHYYVQSFANAAELHQENIMVQQKYVFLGANKLNVIK